MDTCKTRLNKFIAQAGVCSRRKADELISAGLIKVNNTIIRELGFQVGPKDEVWFRDRQIVAEVPVYVVLNKPDGIITSMSDELGRPTVSSLVKIPDSERLFPAGRLDASTTGLLIMTNDGEFAQRVAHPKYKIKKTYVVKLSRIVKQGELSRMMKGLRLSDGAIRADEAIYLHGKPRTYVQVTLHSGRNRIVRRMFEHLGHTVKRLDRIAYGHLLIKKLPRAGWRYLSPKEVSRLKGD